MRSQSEFNTALHWFCKQVGVPVNLIIDDHKAQKSNETRRFCSQIGTTLKILEIGTPWANRVELYIGLLKEAVRKDMRASHSPMCLWDYAIERRAMIHNLVPHPLFPTLFSFTCSFLHYPCLLRVCSIVCSKQ